MAIKVETICFCRFCLAILKTINNPEPNAHFSNKLQDLGVAEPLVKLFFFVLLARIKIPNHFRSEILAQIYRLAGATTNQAETNLYVAIFKKMKALNNLKNLQHVNRQRANRDDSILPNIIDQLTALDVKQTKYRTVQGKFAKPPSDRFESIIISLLRASLTDDENNNTDLKEFRLQAQSANLELNLNDLERFLFFLLANIDVRSQAHRARLARLIADFVKITDDRAYCALYVPAIKRLQACREILAFIQKESPEKQALLEELLAA